MPDNNKESKNSYLVKPLEMFINTAQMTSSRYRNIKDPQLRYNLILDKFAITLDFIQGALQTVCDEKDIPESLKIKIEKLIEDSKNDVQELQEYISNPSKETTVKI